MRRYCFLLILLQLHILTVWGQTITKSKAKYHILERNETVTCEFSYRYSIENDDSSCIIILFTEDNNNIEPLQNLLKRKMLRKYGDFSLSMLAWEGNMHIEDNCTIVPELFVKVLEYGESFDIYVSSPDSISSQLIANHLLICKEEELDKIGLFDFIYYLGEYKFDYPFPYLVINAKLIESFISKSTECRP